MSGDFGAVLRDCVEFEMRYLMWVPAVMFAESNISCSIHEGLTSLMSSESWVVVARSRHVGNAKFYTVQQGVVRGIYWSWIECKKYVLGFPRV